MNQIIEEGSVRVDLLGGTLDIHPINLILKDVVTLNVATSLMARVVFNESDFEGIEIYSKDYDKNYSFKKEDINKENIESLYFSEMTLVMEILFYMGIISNIKIELSSGAPAGSGLGGSSAMAITLMKAIYKLKKIEINNTKILKETMDIEARVLNCGPTGYQDYYPALYGGVLALQAEIGGVKVNQLESDSLKLFLEENISLVFSGKSRFSAVNNWDIYKRFFEKDPSINKGLSQIAALASRSIKLVESNNLKKLKDLIIEEGKIRQELFPNFVTEEMAEILKKLQSFNEEIGLKVCGAGGGGCFIILHDRVDREFVKKEVEDAGMELLEFKVSKSR